VKSFRLVIDHTNDSASNLHFLERLDANRYQKMLLWPWESLGYFQSPAGNKYSLPGVKFQVELVSLPGIYYQELDWVAWRNSGELVYTPIVPGRCFDPKNFRPISEQDRIDPIMGPKIANLERALDEKKP
jgi:hypothetical protein